MSGHQGGVTSKLSKDLSNIQCQLRSGKTIKGKDLTPETKEKLEDKKAAILEKMGAEKEARHNERMKAINDHTTEVVNEAAEKIENKLNEKFAPLDALFGGAASGDLNEQITAARNEVKLKQAWIAAKVDEKKRSAAQKKADAKAVREKQKKEKAKSKRKGKDASPAEEEVASTAEPDEEEKTGSTAEPDEEEKTGSSEEEKNEAEKSEEPNKEKKKKKRRDDVEHSDDESSAEMQEADANVEDCATLVEAREYYDFVKERAARCDEYAKFMLGDLKRDNESIEELAGKLKRARPTWYSPKYGQLGVKHTQTIVEKLATAMKGGDSWTRNWTNVAVRLNHDLSDNGSRYRVDYLKDFFVMDGNRIAAVVAFEGVQ
jgi:hypothetical protein